MSKLGFHISLGDRRGLGELLKACTDAGSPVPVIFAVDQDIWPDVEKFSPQTIVIFRHQPKDEEGGGLDAPPDTYHGNPVQSAQNWMNRNMPVWAKNKAHFYAPINEQDAGELSGYAWLNTFTIECMKIAEANGRKLALYAFSSGNPRDGETVLDRSTLEEKWRELLPSLQMAKANGHILLLHEYGFSTPTLRASAPHLALRYRRSYAFLRQFNANPPLVISEASAGTGGLGIGLGAWLDDVKWYDSELMKDRDVIGCCLYQLGGAERIVDALPKLGDYIVRTPTPVTSVPAEPPHPSAISPDNSEVPPNTKITDSAGQVWSLGDRDGAGRRILRDGVQFAGGQGVLLLLHDRQVFTKNDRGVWFIATEAGWRPIPHDPRLTTPPARPSVTIPHETMAAVAPIGVEPPASHPFPFGLSMTSNLVTDKQATVYKLAFGSDPSPAFKFLTLGDPLEMHDTFDHIKNATPHALFMARLFCPFNPHDPVTPAEFVDFVKNGLNVLYRRGVRLFEVHNEPNLQEEGLGVSWPDATGFAAWLRDVINILKASTEPHYDQAKWLAPGLSPRPNMLQWLQEWKAAGVQNMVDGFCGHSYWKKPDDLSNRHEGLSWLDVKEAFPNKPIYVTEFANKDKDAPFSEKGRQYRTYRNLLRQNGAAAGFVFVLHWTAEQDHDNESWVDEAGGSKGVAESFLA